MHQAADEHKNSLSGVVSEVLEVCIHTILHTRRLYEPEAFERRKVYGIFTRRARHPDLVQYIADFTAALQGPLEKQTLKQVAILVASSSGEQLERIAFDIEVMQHGLQALNDVDLGQLEAHLGSLVLKLQLADNLLQPLDPGCSFELVAYVDNLSALDVPERQYFVTEDPACEPHYPTAYPLKSVHIPGVLSLQVLLQGRTLR